MKVSRFIKTHDRFVRSEPPSERLFAYHRAQIEFLHRERVVHLHVTLGFAVLFLISVGILLAHTSWATIALTALLLVLLVPYIAHYWRLENSVQAWHLLLLRMEGYGPEAVAPHPLSAPVPAPGSSAPAGPASADPEPAWVAGTPPLAASPEQGPSTGLGAELEASAGPRLGPADPDERDIPTLAVQVRPEDLQAHVLAPPRDLFPED